MKIYNIKNHTTMQLYPVKTLGESQNLILHRRCSLGIDSKSRTYYLSLKRDIQRGLLSDYHIITLSGKKLKTCIDLMNTLETEIDLNLHYNQLRKHIVLNVLLNNIK